VTADGAGTKEKRVIGFVIGSLEKLLAEGVDIAVVGRDEKRRAANDCDVRSGLAAIELGSVDRIGKGNECSVGFGIAAVPNSAGATVKGTSCVWFDNAAALDTDDRMGGGKAGDI